MPDPYRALVVDYGGVLTTSMLDSFRQFSAAEGIDHEHLTGLFRSAYDAPADSPVHLVETGSMSLNRFEVELAARLRSTSGGAVAAEGLIQRMFAGVSPDEAMLDAVRRARAAGLRTALLSNSWGNREAYGFDGFDELFDVVVISGERGLRKPDREIFLLAARELGVDPAECVFVDDIAANVRGAAAAGMCAVHHEDTTTTLAELELLLGVTLR